MRFYIEDQKEEEESEEEPEDERDYLNVDPKNPQSELEVQLYRSYDAEFFLCGVSHRKPCSTSSQVSCCPSLCLSCILVVFMSQS